MRKVLIASLFLLINALGDQLSVSQAYACNRNIQVCGYRFWLFWRSWQVIFELVPQHDL